MYFVTYVSTPLGTVLRCHGYRHMVLAQESHLGLLDHQSKNVPKLILLLASRLHREPASSPAGRYLQIASSTE